MAWFDDLKTPRIKIPAAGGATRVEGPSGANVEPRAPEGAGMGATGATVRTSKVPEGLWVKCPSCSEILQAKLLRENLHVCPQCQFHLRVSAAERIRMLTDPDSFEEYGDELVSTDPLEFDDRKPYRDRLVQAAASTGLRDALVCGKAKLGGIPYHLGVFEFRFLGGSMGVVVGERVTLVFERALEECLPAVIVSSSGGARMQEGILSLMQMAKTSALIARLREKGIPYISVLADPTTGGVAASFAMLGDVILAEPGALVGFAGPRVIEQTIRQSLPEGFQRSEFLLKHGFVDRVIPRGELAAELQLWMRRLGGRTCRFPKHY